MTNTNIAFSLQKAQEFFDSSDAFPVDFDLAWEWLDYSRKDVAKRAFDKCGFVENLDYSQLRQSVELDQGGNTYKQVIKLSVECFKTWAMMSQTEKGKQVRLYFLECEKIAKGKAIAPQPLKQHTAIEYIEATGKLENIKDSRLQRLLRAKLEHELSLNQVNQKLLTNSETENFTTLTVLAHNLGYSTAQIGDGVKLGKFIKRRISPAFQDYQGQYLVWHYKVTEGLKQSIHDFFSDF